VGTAQQRLNEVKKQDMSSYFRNESTGLQVACKLSSLRKHQAFWSVCLQMGAGCKPSFQAVCLASLWTMTSNDVTFWPVFFKDKVTLQNPKILRSPLSRIVAVEKPRQNRKGTCQIDVAVKPMPFCHI